MTSDETERIIKRGSTNKVEEKAPWECLFLTTKEVQELLDSIQKVARRPFIYPLFVFAAHTGARRSELLRSRIEDFDFEAGVDLAP